MDYNALLRVIELTSDPNISLSTAIYLTMADETSPLLVPDNPHGQFCLMAGIPPSDKPDKHSHIGSKTLYGRATHHYRNARLSHSFMAAFSNTLLLTQVMIGAALTALGASESSHILITVFGAMNTIIAGLVAYLKSRGQPMRSRMYRDDLERVVDEIENSEVMWLGISKRVHGYDEIDVGDKVTVRSEVARLMRLYEKAVRSNVMNNPDNYLLGQGGDGPGTALRARQPVAPVAVPVAAPAVEAPVASQPAPVVVAATVVDPDESPASAPPKPASPPPAKEEPKKAVGGQKDGPADETEAGAGKDDEAKSAEDSAARVPAKDDGPSQVDGSKDSDVSMPSVSKSTTIAADPDASPASSDSPPKPSEQGDKGKDKKDEDDLSGSGGGQNGPKGAS